MSRRTALRAPILTDWCAKVRQELGDVLRDIYREDDAFLHFEQALIEWRSLHIPVPPSPSDSDASLWRQVDPITPAHEVAAAVGEQFGQVPFNFVNGQGVSIGGSSFTRHLLWLQRSHCPQATRSIRTDSHLSRYFNHPP